jgi:hypothetical protein
MGLLDEAIREHLDLKRRRGADPTEVERDEREALGPVRRAPENSPGTDAPSASPAAFAYDQEDDWEDEPLPETPRSRARRIREESEPDLHDEAAVEDEPQPAPEHRPSRLARIFGKPEPEPVAEPAEYEAEPEYDDELEVGEERTGTVRRREVEEEPPHSARSPRSDDTAAFDTEEAFERSEPSEPSDPSAQEDEDVLEETPEFLQDTPDHDRLWFEQRPPKDFDFDG